MVGRYGTDYIIYPGGEYKAAIEAALVAKNTKMGRGTYGNDEASVIVMASDAYNAMSDLANPYQNTYYWLSRIWANTLLTATIAKAEIDRTISRQTVLIPYIHQVLPGTTSPTTTNWNQDRFSQLLDYIKQNRLIMLTMHDLYMLTQGSWKVGVNW
jgi:hypothetical protein